MEPGCTLLLVEDDEELLEILNRRLTRRGLSVVAVAQPQEAMDACLRQAFHLAVVDRSLPGMDGLELMGRLKSLHEDYLPVIVLSGWSDAASVAAALDAGAVEYLTKPCALADLDDAIQRSLTIGKPR